MSEGEELATKRGGFTSRQMQAVWRIAHEEGFKLMREFWAYAEALEWSWYDVLEKGSP